LTRVACATAKCTKTPSYCFPLRELLPMIEQISWRDYLKDKSRHSPLELQMLCTVRGTIAMVEYFSRKCSRCTEKLVGKLDTSGSYANKNRFSEAARAEPMYARAVQQLQRGNDRL
jgi:hypothetical protein